MVIETRAGGDQVAQKLMDQRDASNIERNVKAAAEVMV